VAKSRSVNTVASGRETRERGKASHGGHGGHGGGIGHCGGFRARNTEGKSIARRPQRSRRRDWVLSFADPANADPPTRCPSDPLPLRPAVPIDFGP
jgi:hypothetical protein